MRFSIRLHLFSGLLLVAAASACGVNSDNEREDLGVPLEVSMEGRVDRVINTPDTEYRTNMRVNTVKSGDRYIQSFDLQIQAVTVREEGAKVIQDRLLLRFAHMGGIPDPGRYQVSDLVSDSTFYVSLIYNEQRRDSVTSFLEQELSLDFSSDTGVLEVLKSNAGELRGLFEITADLNQGLLVEYDTSGETTQTNYDEESAALILTGEFQIE